jgi:hypothetical protein
MSNSSIRLSAILACGAILSASALGHAETPKHDAAAKGGAAHAPKLPASLNVPPGNKLAFSMPAKGVQIYKCQAAGGAAPAWTLTGPEAELLDNKGHSAGKHFAGPTWQGSDGSSVVGSKTAAETVDRSAIPWLLLTATSHGGQGKFAQVTFIQRIETRGGLAPATGCDAAHLEATARVDYTATYVFFNPAKPAKK